MGKIASKKSQTVFISPVSPGVTSGLVLAPQFSLTRLYWAWPPELSDPKQSTAGNNGINGGLRTGRLHSHCRRPRDGSILDLVLPVFSICSNHKYYCYHPWVVSRALSPSHILSTPPSGRLLRCLFSCKISNKLENKSGPRERRATCCPDHTSGRSPC